MNPILSLLNLEKPYLENLVTQTALGLEAIGYQLAVESGKSARQAAQTSFATRMGLIQSALPVPTVQRDWQARAADTYNGIKHANRPLPDAVSMRVVSDENTLVFRVWVASRLGVPASKLKATIGVDRFRQNLDRLGFAVDR